MIHLRTLGQIELAADDGADADALLAQPKRFALLCYLAIPKPGTMFRRDTLLGVFWPEGDSEHTRTALRQALAHIRKALGHDVIVRRGSEEVGLNPDLLWCDVGAFERALDDCKWAEAIELYRGELLKGFYVSNAPEFEHWLEAERAQLAGRYAAALEELANAATAAGKTRAAVEWWQSLVLHDPYDSRLAMGLMEALDRAGDPANALLHARKHVELLREELDVGPPSELEAIAGRIRNGWDQSGKAEVQGPVKTERVSATGAGGTAAERRQGIVAAASGAVPGGMKGRKVVWGAVAAVVVAAICACLLLRGREPQLVPNRVVVAPFENRTGDASLDLVGHMAADWLTNGLTDLPEVQVLLPDDVTRAIQTLSHDSTELEVQPSARAIGTATGAALVITGSYYLHNDELEFHSQVVDASTPSSVLFSAEPTRGPRGEPEPALMGLREQLMGAVAVHLNVVDAAWGEPYVEPRRPPTIGAYNAYAEARAAMWRVGLEESKRLHLRAIELDSTFVAAYMSLVTGPLYNLYDRQAMDSVVQVASRCVENPSRIERTQLEFIRALAVANLPRVLTVLREGQAIAPSPATCTQFTMHAVEANRPREAVEFMESCEGWDTWFPGWYFLTTAFHMLGEHREELRVARRARETLPERMDMRFTEARALVALGDTSGVERVLSEISGGGGVQHMLLIIAEELRVHGHPDLAGRVEHRVIDWYEGMLADSISTPRDRVQYAKALVAARRYEMADSIVGLLVTEYPDHIGYLGYRGVIAARRGHTERAQAISRELATWREPHLFGNNRGWMARIAAVMGDRDEAVALLERGFAEHLKLHPSDWIVGWGDTFGARHNVWPHSEPEFESLRGYEPFEELMRPKG